MIDSYHKVYITCDINRAPDPPSPYHIYISGMPCQYMGPTEADCFELIRKAGWLISECRCLCPTCHTDEIYIRGEINEGA